MDNRRIVRNLLIGKTNYLESKFEYKSALLRGYMAVIALAVGISYFFIDRMNGIYANTPFYLAVIFLALVTIYLNRNKKYFLASVLFLCAINLIIFLFASSDTHRSGVYMFFICSSLSAFALFGHRQIKYAFAFSIISLALCIVSYWSDPLLPYALVSEEYLRINFTTNFVTALVTCLLI